MRTRELSESKRTSTRLRNVGRRLPWALSCATLGLSYGCTQQIQSVAGCGSDGGDASPSGASDAGDASPNGGGAPAVFVVDSTGKLFSFDAQGIALASVALPTPVGALNGGGIASGAGSLYVTIGQPTNALAVFAPSLAPQTLPTGAFPNLNAPRGIAYDPATATLYIGNGAASVGAYGTDGHAIPTLDFPHHDGPSGVAFDPDDSYVWVANYVGAPPASPPQYGVEGYTILGASIAPLSPSGGATFDYATQFVAPDPTTEPYAITVCPASATGGRTLVIVGFIDDGSGGGTRSVQAYSTSGAAVGSPFTTLGNPYALSCASDGTVYVADASGLYKGKAAAGGLSSFALASPGFSGLTAPIYGVVAGQVAGAANTDAGREGGVEGADAQPDAAGDAANDAGGCTSAPTTAGWDGTPVPVSSVSSACVLGTAFPPYAVTADLTFPDDTLFPSCTVFDAPHGITVSSGATLTIKAGVTIAFGSSSTFSVNGGLVVAGTSCAPVVLTSDSATPTPGAWSGLDIVASGATPTSPPSANLNDLIVQFAGMTSVGAANNLGSIAFDGSYGDFSVTLSNVTVSNSFGAGFVFFGPHTGPAPASSGTLTVTDWGSGTDPILIFPSAAGMLAPLHLSTAPLVPKPDAGPSPLGTVHLSTPGQSDGVIDISQTWPSIAPFVYVTGKSGVDNLLHRDTSNIQVSGIGGAAATLTIAAPNTFRLGNGVAIQVDLRGNGSALVANGSTGAPIVFTSLAGDPAPGSWDGIQLDYPGAASSSITNATLDSAGAAIEVAEKCAMTPIYGGAIQTGWFTGPVCEMAGPTLQNLMFTNLPAGAYGVLTNDVAPGIALAYAGNGNTFSGAMSVLVCTPDCH